MLRWLIICEILGGCGISGGVGTGIVIDGGRAWVYDSIRGKWLSTDRLNAIAGRQGRVKNGYLRIIEGQTSNLTGYRMIRDGTITAIAAQTRSNETWTLRVRKNGSATDIASLALAGVAGGHNRALNVDVSEVDLIQVYAETMAFFGIKDPFVRIEIAWRNDSIP